jgi:hypothetical protein
LKDRFDTYYDHVRKVTLELEERCRKHTFALCSDAADNYGGWLRWFFGVFAGRKRVEARRKGAVP